MESLVGAHSRPVGPLGRSLNTFWGVAPTEADDAEAGQVALFRGGPVEEDGLDQLPGLGPMALASGIYSTERPEISTGSTLRR